MRLPAALSGLPPRFWLLWVGLTVNRAGQFVQPLLTFYLTVEKGFSYTVAAAVVATYGVGAASGAGVGGVLADRIGRRPTLLLSALTSAAMLPLLRLGSTPVETAALAFATGFVYDLHRPAVFAMVADIVPDRDRARAFGFQYVAVNLGFALAPTLAGLLATVSYDLTFYAAAAVQVAWLVFVWFALPETFAGLRTPSAARAGIGPVLQDRLFMGFMALCTAWMFLPQQSVVPLSLWMMQQGHSPATFGSVIGFNGLLIVLVQPWLVARIGRADPVKIFVGTAMLYGVGISLHGGREVWVHLLAVSIWTTGEILSAPVLAAVVAGMSPVHARGRYQGMVGMSFALAGVLAPLVGARVLEVWGGAWLWRSCFVLGLLVAVGMALLGPSLRARLARAA